MRGRGSPQSLLCPQDMRDKEGAAGVGPWSCCLICKREGRSHCTGGACLEGSFWGAEALGLRGQASSPCFRKDLVAWTDRLHHPLWSLGSLHTAVVCHSPPSGGAGPGGLQGQPWGTLEGHTHTLEGGSSSSCPESLGAFCFRSLWAAKLGSGFRLAGCACWPGLTCPIGETSLRHGHWVSGLRVPRESGAGGGIGLCVALFKRTGLESDSRVSPGFSDVRLRREGPPLETGSGGG